MQKPQGRMLTLLTRLLILVLVLFMLAVFLRMFTQHVLIVRLGMDNRFTRFVMLDTASILPDKQDEPTVNLEAGGLVGKWNRLQHAADTAAHSGRSQLEAYAKQRLPFRPALVQAANQYEKLIGWNLARAEEYNNAVDWDHGYLTNFVTWLDVSSNAWHTAAFKDHLNTLGIPLLFVQLPGKISIHDTEVNGLLDFYNDNADRLLGTMNGYGVDTLDLRQHITAQGKDYQALFFNTDHHWRPETGLWAARVIAEHLKARNMPNLEPERLARERFRSELYPRWFLGSQGRKLTVARAVPDDFTLLFPKEPVEWTLTIPDLEMEQQGGFDIIYDMRQVEQAGRPYNVEAYGAYLHSAEKNHAYVRIDNPAMVAGGQRVLLLGDSFSTPLMPFLAMLVGRVDLVDLRHYTDSLEQLIYTQPYTAVVMAYSDLYQVEHVTHTSMYDFR